MPKGLVRGVEAEGRVVSWAVAREADEAGVRSVTVETAPAYRGPGLSPRRCWRCGATPLRPCTTSARAGTALRPHLRSPAGFFRVGSI